MKANIAFQILSLTSILSFSGAAPAQMTLPKAHPLKFVCVASLIQKDPNDALNITYLGNIQRTELDFTQPPSKKILGSIGGYQISFEMPEQMGLKSFLYSIEGNEYSFSQSSQRNDTVMFASKTNIGNKELSLQCIPTVTF